MTELASYHQLLIAAAWVDGRLDPTEAEFLQRVLSGAGASPTNIESWLQSPANIDELLCKIPGPEPRKAVMQDILRVCFSDGILEFEEFDLIERVATRLEIDEQALEVMRSQVSAEF